MVLLFSWIREPLNVFFHAIDFSAILMVPFRLLSHLFIFDFVGLRNSLDIQSLMDSAELVREWSEA